MAKFRSGDLVLTSSQEIIQGSEILIGAGGIASFTSLSVLGGTTIDSLDVSGLAIFSTLTFAAGATINLIDAGDLSSDLDTSIPTQKAIKTYVDAQVGGAVPAGVDEALVRYNGINSVQDSGIFIDDSDNVTGVNNLDSTTITCIDLNVSGNTISISGMGNPDWGKIKVDTTDLIVESGGSVSLKGSSIDIYPDHAGETRFSVDFTGSQTTGQFTIYDRDPVYGNQDATILIVSNNTPYLHFWASPDATAVSSLYLFDGWFEIANNTEGKGVALRSRNSSGDYYYPVIARGEKAELRYEGNKKLETQIAGITVSGNVVATGSVYIPSGQRVQFATPSRIEMTYDGTRGRIITQDNKTFEIFSGTGSERMAAFIPNSSVDLYYNGSKVAETTANGISGAVWG